MLEKSIQRVCAAVLLPKDARGLLDEAALARHLEFLLGQGIRSFALNGATGEYCSTSPAELAQCLKIAGSTLPPDATILWGVGSGNLRDTLSLGKIGIEAGVEGLLLPLPYFFPYSQDDAAAFVRAVASELPVPIWLYNLPQFTTGFETHTATALIKECANVTGIKDSSGSLDTLRAITREGIKASRIIGNDGVLAQALAEGICDGVVSGVACVLPEVIQPLFAASPQSLEFKAAADALQQFIGKISVLPTPWGLKAIAEARGISTASYSLPLSPQRTKEIREIQLWFENWYQQLTENSVGTQHKAATQTDQASTRA